MKLSSQIFKKLYYEESKIYSIIFNLRKKNLNRKLEDINNQRKELDKLIIIKKYQATANYPTPTFYKNMDEKGKRKNKVEYCEIMIANG